MSSLSGILQSTDDIVIAWVNSKPIQESARQRIRFDFLQGFEAGFKFIERRGVPTLDIWREAVKKYLSSNFHRVMEENPHELGEFLGSLACGIIKMPLLAEKSEFKEISAFLQRNWPAFYKLIMSLLNYSQRIK